MTIFDGAAREMPTATEIRAVQQNIRTWSPQKALEPTAPMLYQCLSKPCIQPGLPQAYRLRTHNGKMDKARPAKFRSLTIRLHGLSLWKMVHLVLLLLRVSLVQIEYCTLSPSHACACACAWQTCSKSRPRGVSFAINELQQ